VAAAAFLASGLVCGVAWGHVAFTAPAPNAQVVAGSTTELTWVDTISHQTTSYEIEFFPAADAASVVVAANIPPSQHSWSWQVPAQPCMGCFLVVTQHNVDSSYSDSLALAIVAGSAMGASGSTSSPPASEQPASCALGSPGSAPVGSAAWLVCMGVAAAGLRRRRVR
jgi:hypothetical protein